MYFTSGTTKLPKIAVHSHTSYPLGHFTTMSWLGVRPGDVHSVISAPGWAKHAWSSFFGPWNVGATVHVANYAKFKAERIIAELDRVGVTSFCAPPTVWRMLIQSELGAPRRPRGDRLWPVNPCNPEVISRIRMWVALRDGYGQTETTATIGNMPGEPVVPGAMGKAAARVDIVLIDPMTGEEGDEGEVCLGSRRRTAARAPRAP